LATLDEDVRLRLREASARAAFNVWLGLEVEHAADGEVELRLPWRAEFGQYSGYLHAGIVSGLIDTACGFAASTLSGRVLVSQLSIRFMRPAIASVFVVRGRVVKLGRLQVFACGHLYAIDAPDKLLASGDAVLVPVA
jgi:uncharacterized protein (TIGR00369 family)